MHMMLIESLANEILIEVFEYLDTHHLIRAFRQLNIRFHCLLQFYFRSHRLNFESLSKDEYDFISQHLLRFVIDQIPSLSLANDETPGLPEYFLSQSFTLDRFIHLQFLSLSNISSLPTLNQIIYQCQSLQFLTHLHILNRYENDIYLDITNLLDNIWNLKNLVVCQLSGVQYLNTTGLLDISTVSSSIEHLSIEYILSNLTNLVHLFKHTPSLRQFHGLVHSYSPVDQFDIDISSLKSLQLSFGGSFHSLEKLLKTCSNLIYLQIDISRVYIDGDQWKSLIINYLPNLKTFHLRMIFSLDSYNQDIDEILDSFRDTFWIEEHQWFVRCQWNSSDPYKLITIYTQPYVFKSFDCSNAISKSNISHFYIELPRHDLSKLNISMLNSLKNLDLSINSHRNYSQLQILFDQTPNLYSLKIIFAIDLIECLLNLTSSSIQRLNFLEQKISFTKSDCLRLIKSSLGQQCQVLLIRLKTRNSILDLIQHMIHLRLLVVDCDDDHDDGMNLNQWLKQNLSSNDSFIRNSKNQHQIQIWIDRQVKRTLPYRTQLIQYFKNILF